MKYEDKSRHYISLTALSTVGLAVRDTWHVETRRHISGEFQGNRLEGCHL